MNNDLIWIQKTRGLPVDKVLPAGRCDLPWNTVNIDRQGRVFVCDCNGWVPFSVGHVMEFADLDDVFESPQARDVQQAIRDGNYRYCETSYCGVESQIKTTPYDYRIHLGMDDSCNLQCPSCRTSMIFRQDQEYLDQRFGWVDRINDWIAARPLSRIAVMIGSNGDPLASSVYRRFMSKYMLPTVDYEILTNGLLLERHLADLEILPNLRHLQISIDAASADVYHDVRRPGRWEQLLSSLDCVAELRQHHDFRVSAYFVIQRRNLDDVIPFIDFCYRYRMAPGFSLLRDWASWTDFDSHCVHQPKHELYDRFLSVIDHPKFRALNVPWAQSLQVS